MTTFTLHYSDGTEARKGDSMIDSVTGHEMEFRFVLLETGYAYPERGVKAIVIDVDVDTSERISIDPKRVGLTPKAV